MSTGDGPMNADPECNERFLAQFSGLQQWPEDGVSPSVPLDPSLKLFPVGPRSANGSERMARSFTGRGLQRAGNVEMEVPALTTAGSVLRAVGAKTAHAIFELPRQEELTRDNIVKIAEHLSGVLTDALPPDMPGPEVAVFKSARRKEEGWTLDLGDSRVGTRVSFYALRARKTFVTRIVTNVPRTADAICRALDAGRMTIDDYHYNAAARSINVDGQVRQITGVNQLWHEALMLNLGLLWSVVCSGVEHVLSPDSVEPISDIRSVATRIDISPISLRVVGTFSDAHAEEYTKTTTGGTESPFTLVRAGGESDGESGSAAADDDEGDDDTPVEDSVTIIHRIDYVRCAVSTCNARVYDALDIRARKALPVGRQRSIWIAGGDVLCDFSFDTTLPLAKFIANVANKVITVDRGYARRAELARHTLPPTERAVAYARGVRIFVAGKRFSHIDRCDIAESIKPDSDIFQSVSIMHAQQEVCI